MEEKQGASERGGLPARGEGVHQRKRGRRPTGPEAKTYPFSLRLTRAERLLVSTVASRAHGHGLSPATWARETLVAAALDHFAGKPHTADSRAEPE